MSSSVSKSLITFVAGGAISFGVYFLLSSSPRFNKVKRTITAGDDIIHTSKFAPYPETYNFTKNEENEKVVNITLSGGGFNGPPGRDSKMTPTNHMHINQQETFKVLTGKMAVLLNNQVIFKVPNDGKFIVPPNTPHTFWKSEDCKESMTVQVVLEASKLPMDTTKVANEIIFTSRSFFENLVGLMRDYDYNPPLLSLFVILNAHDTYPADVPLPIAKVIIGCGAWLGRLLGHKAHYHEYTTELIKDVATK